MEVHQPSYATLQFHGGNANEYKESGENEGEKYSEIEKGRTRGTLEGLISRSYAGSKPHLPGSQEQPLSAPIFSDLSHFQSGGSSLLIRAAAALLWGKGFYLPFPAAAQYLCWIGYRQGSLPNLAQVRIALLVLLKAKVVPKGCLASHDQL